MSKSFLVIPRESGVFLGESKKVANRSLAGLPASEVFGDNRPFKRDASEVPVAIDFCRCSLPLDIEAFKLGSCIAGLFCSAGFSFKKGRSFLLSENEEGNCEAVSIRLDLSIFKTSFVFSSVCVSRGERETILFLFRLVFEYSSPSFSESIFTEVNNGVNKGFFIAALADSLTLGSIRSSPFKILIRIYRSKALWR